MKVVCDIETNGLDNPDIIWVIVCKEVESGKVHTFLEPLQSPGEFLRLARMVTCWIGHNFLGYDFGVLSRLLWHIDPQRIIDTLVVSRLLRYNIGGHGLGDWGERFGIPKPKHEDWTQLSPEMIHRCQQDVEINYQLYKFQEPYLTQEPYRKALRCEHDIAILCNELHTNGFPFDVTKANSLLETIRTDLGVLTFRLKESFKPKAKLLKVIEPKGTKHGTIHRGDFRWLKEGDLTPFSIGSPFSHFEWEEFNPGSPKQRVEALNDSGWEPWEKTEGHVHAEANYRDDPSPENLERLNHFQTYGWKTSEDNLDTLPDTAPQAARELVRWLLLDSRRSTLEEWLRAATRQPGDQESYAIHGRFHHIGAWTHRMSHSAPNMANVPSLDPKVNNPELKAWAKELGGQMRTLWHVPKGYRQVGTDADGIQLRVLAHYMHDPKFTKALTEGNSELGTDAHTMNWHALGRNICASRAKAKTFIYAWLLGAGEGKTASIFGCSKQEARIARENFVDNYPGLRYIKEQEIPRDARRGYFIGFDGRIVPCDSEYLMLAGYLQNGEACIMKHANLLWKKQLKQDGVWFKQLNFVHDEWQTMTRDNDEEATHVGKVQADSIRIIGEEFGLRCPLAGNSKFGYNWMETH